MNGLDTSAFRDKKVLVIGDVMLDIHHHGSFERYSAEAPIHIHDVERTAMNPGGAANVAINLQQLGVEPVLLSIVGSDYHGIVLKGLLNDAGIDVTSLKALDYVGTTVKSRFYANGQQVFRSDFDARVSVGKEMEVNELLLSMAEAAMATVELVMIQDYNKGVFNPYLIPRLLSLAAKFGRPVLVDPKLSYVQLYKGIKLLKPNFREFCNMLGKEFEPNKECLDEAAADWMQRHQVEQMLITLSDKGVYFRNELQSGIVPGYIVNQPDVSGAGDTVLAVSAACFLKGMSLPETAHHANAAGAFVCSRKGIVPASWEGISSLIQKQ